MLETDQLTGKLAHTFIYRERGREGERERVYHVMGRVANELGEPWALVVYWSVSIIKRS